ncbi:DUF3574 domain-containing protein [Microbulbifer salipaludis]|uniref:DUF3574 domain-containing protein n=1 Tax=Microbulbifer salipaludis TaxID=187980 RepID=A0ABS3E426_9GAMM|nr:DUF3574 domain-containing protein [Microbulbifer salipaludis]MBN8430046.1 DUF3574 domain-containing protein [Microbulbifer salipaludis]
MHSTRMKNLVAALTMAALTACGNQAIQHCQAGESLQFHDLLYFGTERGEQRPVTDAEWAAFVQEVLTVHFPDGLTVLSGTGQWTSGTGDIVRERSHVLSLVHTGNTESEASITTLINTYKTRFDQESVLRVRSAACVAFR